MSGWDISSLDLSSADLTSSDLSSATLNGADFSNTDLRTTIFTNADLTGVNLDPLQLLAALTSMPVINGAVVTVANFLSVHGLVQVDAGGNLSATSDSINASGINIQGGTIQAVLFGLDHDEIGDIGGHGQLF